MSHAEVQYGKMSHTEVQYGKMSHGEKSRNRRYREKKICNVRRVSLEYEKTMSIKEMYEPEARGMKVRKASWTLWK